MFSKKCELYKTKVKPAQQKNIIHPKVVEEILKGYYTLTVYRYYFRENVFKSEIFLQNFEMFYYLLF